MTINIFDNGKILKNNLDIQINDFTVLTGENGSGKTQLLECIRDFAGGNYDADEHGNPIMNEDGSHKMSFPITTDNGQHLQEIVYSYPGLRNPNQDFGNQQGSLIQQITHQWTQLEPFVSAYNSIKHRSFEAYHDEIQHLNATHSRLVSASASTNNQHVAIVVRSITDHEFKQLKSLSEKCGKGIHDLNLLDFIIFYHIPLDLFSSALDLLFHQFFLKTKYYPLLTTDVTTPWDIFNEILTRASFKYKAEYSQSSNEEIPMAVRLIDKNNSKQVDFQSLSSGETTIMALIFALYNSSNNGHFPQVILFDEPDAHLHPSLTQVFLDVIQDVLVKQHNVKVILSTHSPSTVALAPDEAIYCMDRELAKPIKQDKHTAINILSNGLASVTIEESSFGIAYNIRKANKHVLFTEGITDKINIELAWEKLYPGRARNFYVQDCFSANVLGNLFALGDQAPDGIFHQFPELKLMALFDFDGAGYAQWNNKKMFAEIVELDPRKCLTRFNKKNGYLLLLPVPNIAEIDTQVIISGNETYGDKAHLTIESLMYDEITMKDYFKSVPQPGGASLTVFNDNKSKREFSKTLATLEPNAFTQFVPLFDKIDAITSSK